MQTGKKMEKGAGTASSESKATSEGRDGPSSEEVEDPGSILRSKAVGRIFPGTSWFDGKYWRQISPILHLNVYI